VFIFAALSCNPSFGETPDYSTFTTEKLIDELAQIDQPAPGLAGFGMYEAFLAEDKPPRFSGGVLGVPIPAVPPQMRELVRRGVNVLPLLIQHLNDGRPTRLVIGADSPQFFFMFRLFGTEYDPRTRTLEEKSNWPDWKTWEHFSGAYTVKVGDVCYVLIGQIANRNLTAVRYQPTGGLIVNSPLQTPELMEKVKSDWADLDSAGHEASLLHDIRTEDKARRLAPAFQRLRYYYPDRYTHLEGENLAKKQEFEADEKNYWQQAYAYVQNKEYEKAVEEWTKWIGISPDSSEGYWHRAEALEKAYQLTAAIEDYTHALRLEKRPVMQGLILKARARAHEAGGATELAIADLTEVVRLSPKETLTYKSLGDFLDDHGQHQLAIDYYNQAIQLEPRASYLYVDRGLAYRRMGNVGKALEDYNKALELNPSASNAYNARAWALMTVGSLNEAFADITKATSIDPKNADIMDTRAHILLAMDRAEEALASFDAAVRAGKTNPITFFGRGQAYERLDSIEHAIADYKTCLGNPAKNPNDREAQEKARARLNALAAAKEAPVPEPHSR
jgi:tetratricopeptide (TPR) repeat protein